MQRTDAILTRAQIRRNNQQIERGLNSRYSEDRAQFARRSDFTPMPEQIERGLYELPLKSFAWGTSVMKIQVRLLPYIDRASHVETGSVGAPHQNINI